MVAGTRMPLLSPGSAALCGVCLVYVFRCWWSLGCVLPVMTVLLPALTSQLHCSGYVSRSGIYESWFSMFDLLKIKTLP